jgi:hypothetical protein
MSTVENAFGHRLRRVREEQGLSVRDLAKCYRGSSSQVHDFEKGRKRPIRRTAQRIDDALGLNGELVALLNPPGPFVPAIQVAGPTGPEQEPAPPPGGGDEVTRRTFLVGFLAGLGLGVPAASLVGQDTRHIGRDHLDLVQAAMRELERRDAQRGGDIVCDGAAALLADLRWWIQHGSYPTDLEGPLYEAAGQLGAWVGWTAYDADRHDMARRYWTETLLLARMRDDLQLEGRVLSYLSLQAKRQDRVREAAQLAQTGLRVSAGWTTPRMTALLNLRAAHGYAGAGDIDGFRRHLVRARHEFEKGPHEDDLSFLGALTSAEVTGIEGMACVALGQYDKAARLFRQVSEDPDPLYRRNAVYYSVRFADALYRAGDMSGAFKAADAAIGSVAAVASARTHKDLASLRARAGHTMAGAGFRNHYDEVFGR